MKQIGISREIYFIVCWSSYTTAVNEDSSILVILFLSSSCLYSGLISSSKVHFYFRYMQPCLFFYLKRQ